MPHLRILALLEFATLELGIKKLDGFLAAFFRRKVFASPIGPFLAPSIALDEYRERLGVAAFEKHVEIVLDRRQASLNKRARA